MFGECHAHIAMDGMNYAQAMARHANIPDENHIRTCFETYKKKGVAFVRDGGDAFGVSRAAKSIALDYGIDYRTPVFAIHKAGHYGSIVGRSFGTMREYAALVDEAQAQGADFIKIMTTGIMDFNVFGRVTGTALEAAEVREMVHVAHECGFAVMAHVNGKRAVLDAIEVGVDSIEHGNFIDGECVAALKQSRTCFVPTAAVAHNLMGCGMFDESVLARIHDAALCVIAAAVEAGCLVALGSDAGAVGVLHGQGALDEYACFKEAVADQTLLDERLGEGDAFIRATFRHE
ncbi:MAG: amidohydrolase family protein [Eggerthellaceae bacterium]|nr:amidohydrolase family protein [Eggerthellaceae bacterium]